ncbi:transposase [Yokenella regensburgei]|nr:transposase [Yokenella regensburgei]
MTETRVHYGYRRVHVMLRREGWRDNHKRIYRLYSEQGLLLRLKRPRRNKSAPPASGAVSESCLGYGLCF